MGILRHLHRMVQRPVAMRLNRQPEQTVATEREQELVAGRRSVDRTMIEELMEPILGHRIGVMESELVHRIVAMELVLVHRIAGRELVLGHRIAGTELELGHRIVEQVRHMMGMELMEDRRLGQCWSKKIHGFQRAPIVSQPCIEAGQLVQTSSHHGRGDRGDRDDRVRRYR